MSHNAFLIAISQMACRKKVDIAIEGSAFSIQPLSKKGKWLLSSCVFSAEGALPPSIQQCISDAPFLKHQYGGASLKHDPELECVFLVQEVEMPLGSYLAFRKNTQAFIDSIHYWRSILDSFADEDFAYIRN